VAPRLDPHQLAVEQEPGPGVLVPARLREVVLDAGQEVAEGQAAAGRRAALEAEGRQIHPAQHALEIAAERHGVGRRVTDPDEVRHGGMTRRTGREVKPASK
jgi:hypothetical protein